LKTRDQFPQVAAIADAESSERRILAGRIVKAIDRFRRPARAAALGIPTKHTDESGIS